MSILDRFFPKASELRYLNERVIKLDVYNEELRTNNRRLSEEHAVITQDLQRVSGENASLKKRLREQNEADLALVSAKIIMRALQGQKPEPALVTQQDILLKQQQQLSQYQNAGMFSSLGNYGGLAQALGMR